MASLKAGIFGFVLLAVLIFGGLGPAMYGAENLNMTVSARDAELKTVTINNNWTSPDNGTVTSNDCNSNGKIYPSTNRVCDYVIEYNVTEANGFAAGQPVEIRYDYIEEGDNLGEVTITIFDVENNSEREIRMLDRELDESTGMTVETLSFVEEDPDLVELEYTLEEDVGDSDQRPAVLESQLDVVEDYGRTGLGIGDSGAYIFTMVVFLGAAIIALYNSF